MTYPARPLPADFVRRAVTEIRDQTRRSYPVDKGILGVMIGIINRHVGGDANRRAILGYLFRGGSEPLSTHDLEGREYAALYRWMKIVKDPVSGKWFSADPHFTTELGFVAAAASDLYDRAREELSEEHAAKKASKIANEPPEPPAGFAVDPNVEPAAGKGGGVVPNFRAFGDQMEMFFLKGRGEL